jgi:hypothetical protein
MFSRSQWPPGLRHELSSPTPTLRSWVRVPRVLVFCVYIAAAGRADPPSKESYWMGRNTNLKRGHGCTAIIIIIIRPKRLVKGPTTEGSQFESR